MGLSVCNGTLHFHIDLDHVTIMYQYRTCTGMHARRGSKIEASWSCVQRCIRTRNAVKRADFMWCERERGGSTSTSRTRTQVLLQICDTAVVPLASTACATRPYHSRPRVAVGGCGRGCSRPFARGECPPRDCEPHSGLPCATPLWSALNESHAPDASARSSKSYQQQH